MKLNSASQTIIFKIKHSNIIECKDVPMGSDNGEILQASVFIVQPFCFISIDNSVEQKPCNS